MIAAFKAATKDDPSRADYWEGLGDAYPLSLDGTPEQQAPIMVAWQKSLALKPGNTNLRYRLFVIQSKSDPKAALKTLTLATQSDPNNSYLQYGLAELLFNQVHYSDVHDNPDLPSITIAQGLADKDDAASEKIADDALAAIERGNAGRRFAYPDYTPPVPKILRRAWDYWHNLAQLDNLLYLPVFARVRELARATGGYAVVAAHRGDEAEGTRAAQDCIDLGLKMAGDWPIHETTLLSGEVVQGLVGVAVAAIGYSDLQQVYVVTGDTQMAQQAAAEYTAFQVRQKAYTTAGMQKLEQESGTVPLYEYY